MIVCACSPYIPGQVLVLTERGGVCIYHQKRAVITVSGGEEGVALPPLFCLFGAHPRHILWVEGGRLHTADLRHSEVHSAPQLVPVGEGILCVQIEDWQPFHVFIATKTHLMLIDLRQPAETLLDVPHNLVLPPTSITLSHAHNKTACLVLLSSDDDNVVFYCNSVPSFPALWTTAPPHTVCALRDVQECLEKSDLCALACSQVNRFSQHTLGTAMLTLNYFPDVYATLLLTECGDVFYQCWQYSHSTPSPSVSYLTKSQYQGMRLWLQGAHTQQQSVTSGGGLGTVADLSCIAKYLLSRPLQEQQPASHCEDSNWPTTNHCSSELDELRSLYQELIPSNQLDTTMVTEWERTELFEDASLSPLLEDDSASSNNAHAPIITEPKTSLKRRIGF